MLSFSTCWNSHRHTDGDELLSEIRDLGFESVELSHGFQVTLIPGVQQRLKRGRVKICSLHNFCPAPFEIQGDAPDCYEFSSRKAAERARAIRLTKQTIDCAVDLGADRIVLHMGSVPMRGWTRKIGKFLEEGEQHSRKFVRLKIAGIRKRERLAGKYLTRSIEALEEIAAYAAEKKIKLGIESRSEYESLPSEREIVQLMEHFKDDPWVGYWHDFGHIQRKANLNFVDHEEWLRQMKPYLIGCHVHDVEWPLRDHRVPLSGMIDFDKLMPLVPEDIPIVFELSPRQKRNDIRQILPLWEKRYRQKPAKVQS